MSRIEEIDKNFAVKDFRVKEGTNAYNVRMAPFSVHGVFHDGEQFRRMDRESAESVSDGVRSLAAHCAGGRVRFKTDSGYIALRAEVLYPGKMSHFALTGSAGFDMYSGDEHIKTFIPKFDITDELFGEYDKGDGKMHEYTVNFPLYSGVKELYIILEEGARIEAATPYATEKPVVFYGSSITQGGCASRPGNAYPAILSRRLNFDYINLGFSGSAKGEREIAEYIAGLDMSAFVLDYDHNAPTPQHLAATHEPFIDIVRSAHPDIPIICMTQPVPCHDDHRARRDVIERSVRCAREKGDGNIYFIDIMDHLDKKGVLNEASVDRCHPADLGFFFMAEAVGEVMKNFMR